MTLAAFSGQTKAEKVRKLVEWSKKDIHMEIKIQLPRVLKSREVKASDIKTVFVMIGGDHGDMAIQFGVAITVMLHNGEELYF